MIKKKSLIGLGILCIIELIIILSVYGIGRMAGAYAWTIAVLILSPIACIGVLATIVIILIRWMKKKRIRILAQ